MQQQQQDITVNLPSGQIEKISVSLTVSHSQIAFWLTSSYLNWTCWLRGTCVPHLSSSCITVQRRTQVPLFSVLVGGYFSSGLCAVLRLVDPPTLSAPSSFVRHFFLPGWNSGGHKSRAIDRNIFSSSVNLHNNTSGSLFVVPSTQSEFRLFRNNFLGFFFYKFRLDLNSWVFDSFYFFWIC